MTFPPFQADVAQFIKQHNLEIQLGDRMLDLTSEVGELAKEILKSTDYGCQNFAPTDAWADELGDVFFSLICLANMTNIDLLDALNGALSKYQSRLRDKGDVGSTDNLKLNA